MKKLDLSTLHPVIFYAIITLMLAIVSMSDFLAGQDLSLFLFYLIPIYLGSWYRGRTTGIVTACLSGLLWRLVDNYVSLIPLGYGMMISSLLMRIILFSMIALLVVNNKKLYVQMKQMAYTDIKTGAYNYRAFAELSKGLLNTSNREQIVMSLAYFDMDNFKLVNDQHGHLAGDMVLEKFAGIVNHAIRSSDLFARIGGDEFVALFVGSTPLEAQKILIRINERFKQTMLDLGYTVSLSIGIIEIPPESTSIEDHIKKVDQYMYKAKALGKDRIYIEE